MFFSFVRQRSGHRSAAGPGRLRDGTGSSRGRCRPRFGRAGLRRAPRTPPPGRPSSVPFSTHAPWKKRCNPLSVRTHRLPSRAASNALMRSNPAAHHRPVPAVERPDLVLGGAPDPAVRQFGETKRGFRSGFVLRGKQLPFLVMKPGHAMFPARTTDRDSAPRREPGNAAGHELGKRIGKRMERGPVVNLQAMVRSGGRWVGNLTQYISVLQNSQNPGGPPAPAVATRAEHAALGMKLEQPFSRIEQQRSFFNETSERMVLRASRAMAGGKAYSR